MEGRRLVCGVFTSKKWSQLILLHRSDLIICLSPPGIVYRWSAHHRAGGDMSFDDDAFLDFFPLFKDSDSKSLTPLCPVWPQHGRPPPWFSEAQISAVSSPENKSIFRKQTRRTCYYPASNFLQHAVRPSNQRYWGHMFRFLISGPCLPLLSLALSIPLFTHTHTHTPQPSGSYLLYGNTANPVALRLFLLNQPTNPAVHPSIHAFIHSQYVTYC